MKKILLLILLSSGLVNAQIAGKISWLHPRGELGMTMKKAASYNLMYLESFEEHNWRSRYGISYTNFKPRLDTFPVYSVESGPDGTKILPGYQVFRSVKLIYLFAGMDYRIIDKIKFEYYAGFGILGGGLNLDYDEYYETLLSSSVSGGGGVMIGLDLRTGASYLIGKKLTIFGEITTAGYLVSETGAFSHYDFGLGVQYNFR